MQDKKRLLWVDGLRGIACLFVFIHHFMLSFFPASYYGPEKESILFGIDTRLSYTPLGFIINGNFWVNIFILIAAFIPACRIMASDDKDVKSVGGTIILRRYPRLMIPIAVVAFVRFVTIVIISHFSQTFVNAQADQGIVKYMFHAMVVCFFRSDSTVLGPLWSIYYIFLAAPLAVILALPSRKSNRFMPFIYAALVVPIFYVNLNFLPVILGVLLAEIRINRLDRFKEFVMKRSRRALLPFLLLIIAAGCYLGGFPSYSLTSPYYSLLPSKEGLPFSVMYHAFGAFFLVLGLMLWHEFNVRSVFLCKKPAQLLGRFSMGVFLIHSLVIDFLGYFLFDRLATLLGNAAVAGLLVLIVVTTLILLLSWLFNVAVERPSEKLCKKIKV